LQSYGNRFIISLMGRKRKHTIIYLAENKSREFSLSRSSLHFLLVCSAFFLISIIAGSAYIGYRYFSPHYQASNTVRNKTLLKTISSLEEELNTAETYLDSMVQLNNNIRLYADLPEHDLSVENLGIGGRVQIPVADDASRHPVEVLDQSIQTLSSKVAVELENYKNLYLDIQTYKKRLEYMPAITPLKADSYYISSYFGYRSDPFTSSERYHSGIDLAANRGTPVHSAGKGKVIYAGYSYGGYGNMIKVDHGFGYVTVYAHLNKINVSKGVTVNRGDIIGQVGSTGRSTGPHLHYEVQKNGKAVNPIKYMWDESSL
jgi:murein DD-endopeptidase MepM/ murein hydrolase activator NlpD